MDPLNSPLTTYYARRAAEYERIYAKPERQAELAVLRQRIPALLAGRDVLELACGTGYWTVLVAATARAVTGVDVNEEVLAVARAKTWPDTPVDLLCLDLHRAPALGRRFDGALAAFWWSHVPRRELDGFLDVLHACLLPGARVVVLDNRYVEGSSTPISRTDEQGDTWQRRRLDDGSEHEVLKNFPDPEVLQAVLGPRVRDLALERSPHYWLAIYSPR